MNRDDILRMAREAGCIPRRHPEHWDDVQVFATPDVLERFAALVAAAERETCATLVENYALQYDEPVWALKLTAAIRARGEK
jgi:phosphatidylserine/phosphatidylglycerophosphate/cardiolipin synthase-like enzyme